MCNQWSQIAKIGQLKLRATCVVKNEELRSHEYLASPTSSTWSKLPKEPERESRRDHDQSGLPPSLRRRAGESEWDQVDIDHARLHVRRRKRGTPSLHPGEGDITPGAYIVTRQYAVQQDVLTPTSLGLEVPTSGRQAPASTLLRRCQSPRSMFNGSWSITSQPHLVVHMVVERSKYSFRVSWLQGPLVGSIDQNTEVFNLGKPGHNSFRR
jgi:hypothetical protein